MNTFLYKVVLVFLVEFSINSRVFGQLDLPALPPASSAKPEVLINSYTSEKFENLDKKSDTNNLRYDRDRSSRFGPPYDSEDDEYPARGDRNYDRNRDRSRERNQGGEYYKDHGDEKFYQNNDRLSDPPLRDNDGNFRTNYDRPYTNDKDRYNSDRNNNYNRNDPNNNYNPINNDYNNYNRFNPYENQNPSNPFDPETERRLRIETERLRQLLIEIDKKSAQECTLNVAAQWNFETNVNEATQIEALAAQQRYSDFQRSVWEQMKNIDQSTIYDEHLYRQVKLMSTIGQSALPPDQLDRYNRIINDMLTIYNGASICAYEQPFACGLRLQPHLKDVMAKSRDWDELSWVWTEWRRKSGRNMRDLFEQMVDLTNDAAKFNNFSNGADYWMSAYDSPNFQAEMEDVWQEILPLYELVHAYVRRKLREFYGPDKINRNAPLPDHILGNMYGQSWSNILDLTIPYPGRSNLEVTTAMRAQAYTPLVMFQLAEEFYTSMNMSVLPPEFWASSILQEPVDRPILCQPSSWDFCNGQDFRIKMCTDVTHKDFISVHHELSHIQYFLNYRHNPKVFRDGANPGFHEAIGDAISLSISSPKHLQNLGLVQKSVDDTAHDINYLFALALDKVVFLPFALSMENWRWDIFAKKISKDQYNCHWWLLREQYGGIKPPVLRSELDFDPGSKYHVPANIPYMKYYFGAILQFQIHRALCIASGEFDPVNKLKPLHKCNIYRHPEAGNLLKKLMEKGNSEPWQKTLQEVLGEGRLDGSALREYFRPLEEWLRQENLRNQEFVGWTYDGDYCKHSIETNNLQVYGGFYNLSSISSVNAMLLILALAISLFSVL